MTRRSKSISGHSRWRTSCDRAVPYAASAKGRASLLSNCASNRVNSPGVAIRSRSLESFAGRRIRAAGFSLASSRSSAHRYSDRTALMIELVRELDSPALWKSSTARCNSPRVTSFRSLRRVGAGSLFSEESRLTIALGL